MNITNYGFIHIGQVVESNPTQHMSHHTDNNATDADIVINDDTADQADHADDYVAHLPAHRLTAAERLAQLEAKINGVTDLICTLVNAGFLDANYRPVQSATWKQGILVEEICACLGIRPAWKAFEWFWGTPNLRENRNNALSFHDSGNFSISVRRILR